MFAYTETWAAILTHLCDHRYDAFRHLGVGVAVLFVLAAAVSILDGFRGT